MPHRKRLSHIIVTYIVTYILIIYALTWSSCCWTIISGWSFKMSVSAILTIDILCLNHTRHITGSKHKLRYVGYQFQDTEGHSSQGQGLRHGQSLQRQPHSYLKHVCRTHSYVFTLPHPCLYLAVSLWFPGPKDTEVNAYQLCQDYHCDTLNPRNLHRVVFSLW